MSCVTAAGGGTGACSWMAARRRQAHTKSDWNCSVMCTPDMTTRSMSAAAVCATSWLMRSMPA